MKNHFQLLGNQGEDFAVKYLIEKGYQILARNLYTPYGEIDIIARKDEIIAIVEVKTRSTEFFGSPADAVNLRKQKKIRQSAVWWLQEIKSQGQEIRFDVLGLIKRKEEWEITHWAGSFE